MPVTLITGASTGIGLATARPCRTISISTRSASASASPGKGSRSDRVAYGPSTNPHSAWRTVTLYEVAPAGIGTQKTARLPAGMSAETSRSLVLTTWPVLPSPCTLIATRRAGSCRTLRTSPQTARHSPFMALSLHDGRRLSSETALTVWATDTLLSPRTNPVASSCLRRLAPSLLSRMEGLRGLLELHAGLRHHRPLGLSVPGD